MRFTPKQASGGKNILYCFVTKKTLKLMKIQRNLALYNSRKSAPAKKAKRE